MKLNDYYYSATSEQINNKLIQAQIDNGLDIQKNYFKNQLFTECILHGKKPLCNFKDLIFIGSGYDSDTTYEVIHKGNINTNRTPMEKMIFMMGLIRATCGPNEALA